MISFYRTDNDIAKFFRKSEMGIWQRPLEDLTVNSIKLTRPPKKRSTERAFGKSMILAIARAAKSSGLTIREKPRIFFSLKLRVKNIQGFRTRTMVSLAPIFLARTAAIMFTSSYSVRAIKMSQSWTLACSRMVKSAPLPRIPMISKRLTI